MLNIILILLLFIKNVNCNNNTEIITVNNGKFSMTTSINFNPNNVNSNVDSNVKSTIPESSSSSSSATTTTAATTTTTAATTATATATTLSSTPPGSSSSSSSLSDTRIYHFKKCGGAGCPYTASWYLDSTKMEAASFSIFDAAPYKFQLSDPDAYYVHHMSMFEHLIHKKQGFQEAQNKTSIMSKAAIIGECGKYISLSKTTEYLALIPFFGGLPPNVTADFSAVKSIGQGNSLVSPSTKALQCLASLCSVLKYFGHAVIGTTRNDDRLLIEELLDVLRPEIKDRVDIIQFSMNKPAHLPFHLLAWGQNYVQKHNCMNYGKSETKNSENIEEDIHEYHREKFEKKLTTEGDEYSICKDNVKNRQFGTSYEVKSHKKSPYYENIYSKNTLSNKPGKVVYPIRYIYYTENDQIVRFDSDATFYALSAACNDTTFFTGRRKEKQYTSEPNDYMGELLNWRNCGTPGWSMDWPNTRFVRVTPT